MFNYIWAGFFIVALIVGASQAIFMGNTAILGDMVNSTFEMAEFSVMGIALPLCGVMTLWLGLMNIGEKAGAINVMSRVVGPFFSKLFPEIPKGHPASGQLVMNFSANLLGLDNAATPLGLKAMQSLQDLNPKKDTASNAQIMFLALNTSGLTIIPVAILAQRAILGAANPTDVFVPLLISTYVSTLSAIIFVGIKQRLNLLNWTVMGWLLGLSALIGGMCWWLSTMSREGMTLATNIISNGILLIIMVGFIAGALKKKVNVFEAFIEGAKGGFETSVKIIPYMVGTLVGIAVFRASGALGFITDGLAWFCGLFTERIEWVDAMPTAFMKPLSGSGAKAMMVECMKTFGPDSFAGRLSCLFQGAADTTFYIVALYFGSVGVKKTRYAIGAGLFADLMGVIAAIFVAYLFFF